MELQTAATLLATSAATILARALPYILEGGQALARAVSKKLIDKATAEIAEAIWERVVDGDQAEVQEAAKRLVEKPSDGRLAVLNEELQAALAANQEMAQAVRELVDKAAGDGISVDVGGDVIGDLIVAKGNVTIIQEAALSREEKLERRNRRNFLRKVHNFWVEDVLEKSLHSAALIELGMEEHPDAVDHPLGMVLEALDQEKSRALPTGTKMVDVFDEMNGALLILGAPGSGKTTMLLGLLRDTVTRAEADQDEPIPVVFNLSSWAEDRKPLAEWLVDELSAKYLVPRKIGRAWVDQDQLLLLLDGLDEVREKHREACVEAVNHFRQEHMTPLAVCSRTEEYKALTARLKLEGAVLLQPLTDAQIEAYLKRGEQALSALADTVQDDPALREMAKSPLMLSIMTLAYQGVAADDLAAIDTLEARRAHLFGTYVRRMFRRRRHPDDERYPPAKALRWLIWLARQMTRHAQTVFLIERMQPSWLETRAQPVHILASIVSAGLIGGLFFGLLGTLLSPLLLLARPGLGDWLVGVTVGVLFGMQSLQKQITLAEALTVSLRKWSWSRAVIGMIIGLAFWMVILVASFLREGTVTNDWLVQGLRDWMRIGLRTGVPLAIIGGLSGGLVTGEVEARTIPNQGIRRSARSAAIVALAGGLSFGVIFTLVASAWGGLRVGLTGGLFLGLIYGGRAVAQHISLRVILTLKGHMPANYARFLDYAVERLFLRKVGGSYIFVHRLLLEYFAELTPEQLEGLLG